MSANSLLYWMSARREGSWAQFRAAVEELHIGDGDAVESDGESDDAPDQFGLSLYQALRFNLQRLGHVEFFAGAGEGAEWRVTPPVLAVTPHAHGHLAILVGARSLALIERLHTATRAVVNLQILSIPTYPDQLLMTVNGQDTLAEIAERAGLILQSDAPAALLAALPPVDDRCVRHTALLPFGSEWKIDRFSPDHLAWHSATLDQAAMASGGLFRFSLRHQRYVLYCEKGAAFRIPGQVGKYLVLKRRRRQVLRYDDQNQELSVAASCRPPFLIERALILCSGSPASFKIGQRSGTLHYAGIPERIAAMTAALLRQELR